LQSIQIVSVLNMLVILTFNRLPHRSQFVLWKKSIPIAHLTYVCCRTKEGSLQATFLQTRYSFFAISVVYVPSKHIIPAEPSAQEVRHPSSTTVAHRA
jgi:uncharacterized membrane protein